MKFACVFLVFVAIALATVLAESGTILVRNNGGYVAVFNVEYDLNGEHHNEESGKFTLGVNKDISIPNGAKNIHLKVEEYWFFGSKTTVFTKVFDSPVTKCYSIWGTTLNPQWGEEIC